MIHAIRHPPSAQFTDSAHIPQMHNTFTYLVHGHESIMKISSVQRFMAKSAEEIGCYSSFSNMMSTSMFVCPYAYCILFSPS